MSHLTLRRVLYSEQDTRDLAASLARLARPGDVIALEGDLGAGKTVFARAFVTALGGGEEVRVPQEIDRDFSDLISSLPKLLARRSGSDPESRKLATAERYRQRS